jgi:hypothetical protein
MLGCFCPKTGLHPSQLHSFFFKFNLYRFAMNQKRNGMRCLAFLAFLAICSLGIAQMPNGFPTMPNTGNPQADAEAYEQAKTVWIANNPSSPVNSPVVVTQPTEIENAAYEANKVQAGETFNVPTADVAEHQLRKMEAEFRANQAEWATSNVRLREAYMAAFSLARGQTIVTISAQDYATFHQELRDLVNANTVLFNVTQ